ncbi:MAG TPA: twin-arginine translocase TatA/TatE family subunit [Planctomycetota bacterium]|nr:twin-arginine translocase TatA/TatE family subunit [Planctomycetota bacterium]
MHAVTPVLGIFGLGTQEIVLIFLIVVLLFGASKLPGVARSLGKSVNEFKSGMREGSEPAKPEPTTPPAPDPNSTKN